MGTSPNFTSSVAGLQTSQPQWLRKCSLIVADANGNGVDLSSLHIKFSVTSATAQTAKKLEATIYNLADSTAQQIQNEFVQVQLMAGYQGGPYGIIFNGAIAYVRRGREDAITTFVTLTATDADAAYNWGTIQVTLAAGASQQNILNSVLTALQPYGIKAGNIPTLASTQLPRGKVMYGMVRDVLTDLANSCNCYWHFGDGQLNFVPRDGYIPGDVITISSSTGMIGVPEQTLDGLNVRALLNPNLKTGHLIQVPTSAITTGQYNSTIRQPNASTVPYLPGLSTNGLYMIYSLTQVGDTRSTPWYSEMICEARNPVNSQALNSQTRAQAVVDGS
jgi:hypothetical protein